VPSLGLPKVCLPRWGPSRAGVRWFLAGEPGNPGLTALQRGLAPYVEAMQGAPPRAYWLRKDVNTLFSPTTSCTL
jgi:hypothetical protein